MKIIIYAIGQIFERYKDIIDWSNIEALCDKNIEEKQLLCQEYGMPMIMPEKLSDLDYDFIAVFSNVFFEEIKQKLFREYAVPKDKIISWKETLKDAEDFPADSIAFCRKYLKDKKLKSFLDIGMSVLPKKYLTKSELLLGEDIILDGISGTSMDFNKNLYDNIYAGYSEIRKFYDVAVLWEESQYTEDVLSLAGRYARYLIFTKKRIGVLDGESWREILQKFGKAKCVSTVEGDFWVIDTKHTVYEKTLENTAIFVVTHKKYNLNRQLPYIPLCVGGYREEGCLTEQTGENISYLNYKINECTALYWIWKNTKSEYVGLNHYRRYFYNNEIISMDNYLDIEYINEIFKEYDMILPKAFLYDRISLLEQIRVSINDELCQKGYFLLRRKIEQKQPKYLSAFDSVMSGQVMFSCNMFVTKREILNRYCEWLFSFLIEAAEEINVEGYDSYSQRVMGFFAERMWTVWLRRNKLRIKELPYLAVK